VTDPIMLSIASAVAGKAAETVTEGGKSALAALVRLIRGRLRGNSAATRALESAPGTSADQSAVHALTRALEQAATADPEFAAHIRELWPQVRTEISAQDGGTVNTSTGTVGGHLIQARDLNVHGGIHLGSPPAP
jgi:hypothetical protein